MNDNLITHPSRFRHVTSQVRICLIKSSACVFAAFIGLYPFRSHIYTFVAAPLMRFLPTGGGMIATDVASPFLTPFKLTFTAALFICAPFLLFQGWSLAKPLMHRDKRRTMAILCVFSTLLFYTGTAFPYFVVFPLIFKFFTSAVPQGVEMMTDISLYLDFIMTIFMAFGLAFQIPVFVSLLILSKAVEVVSLRRSRPYVIIGCFVVGMVLTPPDIFSQTMLAVAMWLLFELGLLIGNFLNQTNSGLDKL